MAAQRPTLLFVYNSDGDLISGIKSNLHKYLKPSSYQCRLCALTWGPLTMKRDWKHFVKSLGFSVDFLHRDEFRKKYNNQSSLPAAFLYDGESLEIFISAKEMNRCKTLAALELLVTDKLKKLKKNS